MNKVLYKIVSAAVAVAILFYLGVQIYNSAYNPVVTQTAMVSAMNDSISAKGFVIRHEQYVAGGASGVMIYAVADGNRVGRGNVIASVYQNKSDANVQRQINELNNKITLLSDISTQNASAAPNLDQLNSQITARYNNLMDMTDSGNFTGLQENTDSLLQILTQNQVEIGKMTNLSSLISGLNAQVNTLKAGLSGSPQNISATDSGCFIAQTDGYENAIPYQNALSVTPEQLSAVAPGTVPQNVIGKLMTSFDWYIACNINNTDAAGIKAGERIRLLLPQGAQSELSVTVATVNKGSGNLTTVIFSTNAMNEQLSHLRNVNVDIIKKSYNAGIKVPNSAIKTLNGKQGVYVDVMNRALFKTITPLYQTPGYTICRPGADSDQLRAYDAIILKGNNVYDRKILK